MVKQFTVRIHDYPYTIREEGDGVPFIWLHGMFHSLESESFFSVFDFGLLARYVRVIRIELPAHGNSPVRSEERRVGE